jgi:hypothetical protein
LSRPYACRACWTAIAQLSPAAGVPKGHEAVTEEDHLDAAVGPDGPPDDRLMFVQHLVGDPVTMPGL